MADERIIAPAKMQLSRRQTLAKAAAVASSVEEAAGGFLVAWWPTTELELQNELARSKALSANHTSFAAASSSHKPCVHGPPSRTLGHILEEFLGTRPATPSLWNGLSRTCKAADHDDLQQMPALQDALRVCSGLVQSFVDQSKTTTAQIVFTDKASGASSMCLVEVKTIKGWQIINPASLTTAEASRRAHLLAFAQEACAERSRQAQDLNALVPDDALRETWKKMCLAARDAFHMPTAPPASMKDHLQMCAAQVSCLELARGSNGSATAPPTVAEAQTFSPLTSVVKKAAQLLKIPGGLANAQKVLGWVGKALGARKPESVEVEMLQQTVEVAEVWVQTGLARPSNACEKDGELQKLRCENTQLKDKAQSTEAELEELRREVARLTEQLSLKRTASCECSTVPAPARSWSAGTASGDPLEAVSGGSPGESPSKRQKTSSQG